MLARHLAGPTTPTPPQSGTSLAEFLAALLFAAAIATLVMTSTGCQCGPNANAAPTSTELVISPAPTWWDLASPQRRELEHPESASASKGRADQAVILSSGVSNGEFTLRETTAEGTQVLLRKTTNFGALQVEREPTHGALVLAGLNPDRVPVLYTAFIPGLAPVELLRCDPTRPAARFSVGSADATGFWVAFDADCRGTTDGTLLVQVRLEDGVLRVGAPAPFRGPSQLESRRVLLHPTERLAAVLDVDATHLIRFDASGRETASGAMPPRSATFVGFVPDAPTLLSVESLLDGRSVATESALGTDGGVFTVPSALEVGAGPRAQPDAATASASEGRAIERVVAVRGNALTAALVVQSAAGTQVMVRSGGAVRRLAGAAPPGAQVRVRASVDGGVDAVQGTVVRDGGTSVLVLERLGM